MSTVSQQISYHCKCCFFFCCCCCCSCFVCVCVCVFPYSVINPSLLNQRLFIIVFWIVAFFYYLGYDSFFLIYSYAWLIFTGINSQVSQFQQKIHILLIQFYARFKNISAHMRQVNQRCFLITRSSHRCVWCGFEPHSGHM